MFIWAQRSEDAVQDRDDPRPWDSNIFLLLESTLKNKDTNVIYRGTKAEKGANGIHPVTVIIDC